MTLAIVITAGKKVHLTSSYTEKIDMVAVDLGFKLFFIPNGKIMNSYSSLKKII